MAQMDVQTSQWIADFIRPMAGKMRAQSIVHKDQIGAYNAKHAASLPVDDSEICEENGSSMTPLTAGQIRAIVTYSTGCNTVVDGDYQRSIMAQATSRVVGVSE